MNSEQLYRLEAEIQPHFEHLGKWQVRGLIMMVCGLILQQEGQLSRIAEQLSGLGRYGTVKKRLKRWLVNPRISMMALFYAWMTWVLGHWGRQRPILLVDETKLGNRMGIMMVALAYRHRAIPLIWRCYPANSAEDYPQQGQVLLIYGLLAHVLSCLPPGVRPIVEMDRGLAHTARMIRALNQLGVGYCVRVKATARFTTARGHSFILSQKLQRGQAFTARGTLFGNQHRVSGYIRLIWLPDQPEAWCIFVNEKHLTARHYALRWWQEESFKDLKSAGWQLESSQLRCPRRLERLLFVMAVAYAWTLSLGTLLELADPLTQALVADRDEFKRMSLFRLGLRWFLRLHATTPNLLHLTLCFHQLNLLSHLPKLSP